MAKEGSTKKSLTYVSSCTCSHVFQDTEYGRERRVFNTMKSGKSRCTVCGAVKN
jgi:hypothetical protein